MKERPIIFSGPMVRAILKGMKFKTRRVVKVEDVDEYKQAVQIGASNRWIFWSDLSEDNIRITQDHYLPHEGIRCPYGDPGDRLWVREAAKLRMITTRNGGFDLVYRADDAIAEFPPHADCKPYKFTKWTPSIHMPRWASRISLTIKSVTVERLWDMTEEEARAEGTGEYHQSELVGYPQREETWGRYTRLTNEQKGIETPRIYTATNLGAFAMLWDKLNSNWNENPWVWVIEFSCNGV